MKDRFQETFKQLWGRFKADITRTISSVQMGSDMNQENQTESKMLKLKITKLENI